MVAKIKRLFQDNLRNIERIKMVKWSLYGLVALIMYLTMLSNVIPESLDVSLYSRADHDIASPITIENKTATEDERSKAAQIDAKYVYRDEVSQSQVDQLNDLFSGIEKVKNNDSDDAETTEEKITELESLLSVSMSAELSNETLVPLLEAELSQISLIKELTLSEVMEVMTDRVSIDNLEQSKTDVEDRLSLTSLPTEQKKAMITVAQQSIVPNYFLDPEQTEQSRQEAIEAVQPVMIREGQIIVEEGAMINREVMEQLRLAGLLDEGFDAVPYIGLALLVVLLTGYLYYFFQDVNSRVRSANTNLLILVLIYLSTLLVLKLSSLMQGIELPGIAYIVPVAVGSMLIKMLFNEQLAIASSFLFGVCAGVFFNGEITGPMNASLAFYVLMSSLSGVFFLGKRNHRSNILKAGLLVSLINIVSVAILLMLKNGQYSGIELSYHFLFAFVSGFLSSMLTLGLMPFFEAGFRIISTTRLIELSNPNHPLLRKILVETPGTYHHSVMVANLSEAACESIGANGLLARVGAYYHDIGKTKRPHFFIENQMNMENPHDKISPYLSKTIIVSHATDGAEMLRMHRLPKEIVDIAEQHHGTTLLKFFYYKASEQSDQQVSEAEFRYPGPRAQTKEAAVVGIADCIEAAVRSMNKPNPDTIESLVRKIITERLEDGQFDECDLSLRELDIVAKTILETLNGIFHSRIEYPTELKKKVTS
ncbi:HD family phosphohydrolase [Alkalihalobacillus hwajinpoensis]|uniref:HD family phosphohydrolase n=1 Tax=Guptibacillus hwajinpoensis TaxID=208199 RepID=UPI0018832371|nr:HD family phosphohydrolase [Pseudalkalibacillus hwajinpoensis]MBF0706508.1 HD family phosphohydrolase [Pseudalkalibacillus hwajinpoensis]